MNHRTRPALSAVVTLALVVAGPACASQAPEPGVSTASAAQAAEPAADLSGTWAFALDSSDVASHFREKCKKECGGDAKKEAACWAEIHAEAAKEKIRFAQANGKTVWTSFGEEEGKEKVFLSIPVELAADGPGHVLAKVAGAPTGDMAERFAKSNTNVMHIDVIDAKTIAMNDPKKGRLVYTKE